MSSSATEGGIFTGELDSNQKYAGWGTLLYPSGLLYEGFFEDGAFHGEGKLTFPDGSTTYTAHYSKGLEIPGTGALHFPDGLLFNPTQTAAQTEAGSAAAAAPGEEGSGASAAPASSSSAPSWPYLSAVAGQGFDRRLWEELSAGKRAAVPFATSPQKVQVGKSTFPSAEEEGQR